MNVAAPSWAAEFSPLVFNCVPRHDVQAAMREMFGLYGLPLGMRLDNGLPWGGGPNNELPSAFALWLVGLGVELTFNPPRQPRYNGVVEKSNHTNQRWSEPHTAASAAVWQHRVDEMDRRQRDAYPYQRGRSRLEVFPQLKHSGRPYSASWEEQNWDLQRAREYLACFVARRQVTSAGRVTLYHRAYYVGRKHAGTTVLAYYDPQACEWFMTEEGGGQIRRWPAPEICRERILALDISAD
jgi:hypothetical protein